MDVFLNTWWTSFIIIMKWLVGIIGVATLFFVYLVAIVYIIRVVVLSVYGFIKWLTMRTNIIIRCLVLLLIIAFSLSLLYTIFCMIDNYDGLIVNIITFTVMLAFFATIMYFVFEDKFNMDIMFKENKSSNEIIKFVLWGRLNEQANE